MKVLLAEDDFINQEVERSLLEKLGCEVTTVENGREVLDALKTTLFDIIFMDCNMPEMDGYAATQAIRKLEQETGTHIPIVALTANAAYGDSEHCLAVGMDAYLNKPLKTDLLQDVLCRFNTESGAPVTQAAAITTSTTSFPNSNSAPINTAELLVSNEYQQYSVLNEKTVARLKREMQTQGIDWLLDLYLNELPNYLNQLQCALLIQNAEALHLAAHKLKGSSHSLGADQIMNLCKFMESAAKDQDFKQAEQYLTLLKAAIDDAKIALTALREMK